MYVDARPEDIERWYLNRFRRLRETAFQNPSSYFLEPTQVSEEEALDYARTTWRTINKVNLLENVAPTRGRATLIPPQGPGPQGAATQPAQAASRNSATITAHRSGGPHAPPTPHHPGRQNELRGPN